MTGLDERHLQAVLAYIPLLVLVPWLTRRDDPFINFHVRQGLLLLAGFIISAIMAAWNGAAGSFLFLLLLLADVAALTMALQGRQWKIPLLGAIAGKFRV